jgi:hypothetical protein
MQPPLVKIIKEQDNIAAFRKRRFFCDNRAQKDRTNAALVKTGVYPGFKRF